MPQSDWDNAVQCSALSLTEDMRFRHRNGPKRKSSQIPSLESETLQGPGNQEVTQALRLTRCDELRELEVIQMVCKLLGKSKPYPPPVPGCIQVCSSKFEPQAASHLPTSKPSQHNFLNTESAFRTVASTSPNLSANFQDNTGNAFIYERRQSLQTSFDILELSRLCDVTLQQRGYKLQAMCKSRSRQFSTRAQASKKISQCSGNLRSDPPWKKAAVKTLLRTYKCIVGIATVGQEGGGGCIANSYPKRKIFGYQQRPGTGVDASTLPESTVAVRYHSSIMKYLSQLHSQGP